MSNHTLSPLRSSMCGHATFTVPPCQVCFGFAFISSIGCRAARYPNGNRASSVRDFNSSVARAIPSYQPDYPGGRFWGRRYSAEYLPGPEDVEENG